jgi:ParE toxin of type II toxin-antitoxin system, parDE
MSTTPALSSVLAGSDEECLTPQAPGARQSEVRRVSWTPEADADLQSVVNDPAVRDQLKRNAEETLHEIAASADEDRRAQGFEGEIMWHRGWTHEQERRASWHPEQADDGPWNYVLFYRSAVVPAKFVVLAVRSHLQIADRIWQQLQTEA